MKDVPIGRVRRPHGLKGEVIVEDYAAGTYEPPPGQPVLLAVGSETRASAVTAWRKAAQGIIARFEGCEDRTAAEKLRDGIVLIPRADLPALPDGEYYQFELIGLPAVDIQGRRVGEITEMYAAGETDILVIKREQRPPLEIPFVRAHVAEVRTGQYVKIHPYAEIDRD